MDYDGEVLLVAEGFEETALPVNRSDGLSELASGARAALGLGGSPVLLFSVHGEELEGAGTLEDWGLGFGERVDVRVSNEHVVRAWLQNEGVTPGTVAVERLTGAFGQGSGADELLHMLLASGWDRVQGMVMKAVKASRVERLDLSRCGLTSLDHDFLSRCPALQEVALPDTVTTVGDCVFSRCPSLRKVVLPAAVVAVGDYFAMKSGVTHVDLSRPRNLHHVGEHFLAFTGNLEEVALPASLRSVGPNFLDQSGVRAVDLSHATALHTLSNYFLSSTHALQDVQLPSTLRVVGYGFMQGSNVKLSREAALARFKLPHEP
eukprot:TRINITY_DN32067_c0_g1_i1.p1 TRINITY_DN32067_c0_g1~~TRINITY_DN32067_c0_g1_i1.p1  ORF type:complete len:341 (+),score=83.47 TRINITY_DN32067_c0_g1_i1:65-1024(+)